MLCITLATRSRPQILLDTLRRTLPNVSRADTKIVVAIDEDDTATIDGVRAELVPGNLKFFSDQRFHFDIRPREDSIGEKWNRGFTLFPNADLHMHMADYTAHVTSGFDQKMLDAAKAFPDGIGVVFAAMVNMSFAGTQGVTRKLCELLDFGGMYPPYFPYWFVDHWIDDIARLIDRISYADVHMITPHRKQPTQEMREPGFWATFYDSMRLMRRRQAAKIIAEMKEPKWRKQILLSHHPLIEYRSQCINDMVRAMQPPASLPGGPRYDRLKEQAQRMMALEWPELEKEIAA